MVHAPGITVNGLHITIEQINEEVQYHPAETLVDAKNDAMRALVIREILIQEAVRQGLCERDNAVSNAEAVIEELLKREIDIPEADVNICKHYYESNQNRFYTAPLFEVSHIFFPAPPGDTEARHKARHKAKNVLAQLTEQPALFEKMAKEYSACESAKQGGHLGQITKGQTVPAFEAALNKMQAGELSAAPVESEVGFHIIKVHEREDGRLLPFENVKDWIADFLKQQSWQRGVSQYIQILAGNADISGYQLKSSDTPLVQ